MFDSSSQYDEVEEFGDLSLVRAKRKSKRDRLYVVKKVSLAELAGWNGSDEASRESLRQRLLKKIEQMKGLKHDHIVKVHGSFFENDILHIVMDYCECGTLQQAIDSQKGEPFAEDRIRYWTAQLVSVLKHLHKHKIVLGYINPQNIFLVNETKQLKLSNRFILDNDHSQNLETHLAPEIVIANGKQSPPSVKADMWALGVVVYQIAALRPPFLPGDGASLSDLIRSAPIPPISSSFSKEMRTFAETLLLVRDVAKRKTDKEIDHDPFIKSAMKQLKAEKAAKKVLEAERKLWEKKFEELRQALDMESKKRSSESGKLTQSLTRKSVDSATYRKSSNMDSKLKALEASEEKSKELIDDLQKKLKTAEESGLTSQRHVADLETVLEACKATEMNLQQRTDYLERRLVDTARELEQAQTTIEDLRQEISRFREGGRQSPRPQPKMTPRFSLPAQMLQRKSSLKADDTSGLFLITASKIGDIEQVRRLLLRGAEVETKDRNFCENTPLIWAARNGHLPVVELLLGHGANIEAHASDGATPLTCAAIYGHHETVKFLIERGADFDKATINGDTPLLFAADSGHTDIVALLLDKGADPESRNANGSTPLIQAASNGHVEVVQLLLDYGVDINTAEGKLGGTALIEAAANGYAEVVDLLLKNGASLELKGFDGATALLCAAACGRTTITRLLLKQGANIEARSDEGATPLILAAQNGHLETVQLLLDRGADVNAKAKNGNTALMCAREQNHAGIVQLLL